MKMYKVRYGIFLLLLAQVVQAQPQIEIDQKYNSIMQDLRLIKKCYVNRSSKCTAKEQVKAQAALKSIGKKVGVLVTIIGGGLLVRYAYGKATRTVPGKETPYERHAKQQVLKTQAQEGLKKESAKGAQGF